MKTIYFAAKPMPIPGETAHPVEFFGVPETAMLAKVQRAVFERIGHHQQYSFLELKDIVELGLRPRLLPAAEVC